MPTYKITRAAALDAMDRMTIDASYREPESTDRRELLDARDGIRVLIKDLREDTDETEIPAGSLEDMILHYDADVTEIA
jgi:hypothetical protein